MARAKGLRLEVHGDKELAQAFTRAAGDIGPATDRVESESARRLEKDAPGSGTAPERPVARLHPATGGTVIAGAVYAGPIHFGWRDRPNPARGWRGGPIAPNPFLFDAVDEPRIEEEFSEAVDQVTAKV